MAVWHVLAEQGADRFAEPGQVACSMFAYAYRVGVKNQPDGQSALQFTRDQLDRLKLGHDRRIFRGAASTSDCRLRS